MTTYYCGKCYGECDPEIYTVEAFGAPVSDVVSSCCEAEVYSEEEPRYPVTVLALPAADHWMERGSAI